MDYNFRILVSNTAGVRFELERTYPFPDTIRAARIALALYADVTAESLPARQSYSDGLAFWEDGDVRWTAVATRVDAPVADRTPAEIEEGIRQSDRAEVAALERMAREDRHTRAAVEDTRRPVSCDH